MPTIKVDTSLAHSKFVQQHRFYEKMGTKAHPDCLRGSSPRSHLFAQLDRHNIGNGSAAVVVSMCHRDVLESDLSRASSRLTLGLCVTSESGGEFLY